MIKHFLSDKLNHSELCVYHKGTQNCKPRHSFGPAVRDHFLIHYIHSGKGTYHVSGKKYTLNSGQGFLIFPNVTTYYEADDSRPWHYSWIGFHGINALNYLEQSGLSVENPIINNQNKNCMENLFN